MNRIVSRGKLQESQRRDCQMNRVEESPDTLEELRSELTGYCYRMMGSIFEAEDAVQDTMIQAWQNRDRLRQQSARKAWVYRIATNICLDRLRSAKRRALPMDLSEPAAGITEPRDNLSRDSWIWPAPGYVDDPGNILIGRETLRLSFIALLQLLPPRQRAVLILQEVFRWSAGETANALEMSVAAVNSAMQRARATMARAQLRSGEMQPEDGEVDEQLIARYVEAFEQYDIAGLIALFQENGSLSMPPFTMWVQGGSALSEFYDITRSHCTGSRLLPVRANGNRTAFAQYVPAGEAGLLTPWAIHVLETGRGKIAHVHHFIDAELFIRFESPEYR
ncbi:sigma-70 family RNA polymerase sigma factor [Paenibacillus sp. MMS20-IR301]|uniref:sigma-70 family RNA polymerase sigma factor n=1 Tax=Paenibacillus sp. MMS20-IR301 TaxID=2895946 RepID=UPI0028E2F9ED|nr:sigma-70 family RNA polymerase sigma factor [Paenibacillus sp. MMS20-IR301]WNS44104.1 sigma-70 family RNA polymerase sigma factor [Paenibacillus sp. MMS20-IR301]